MRYMVLIASLWFLGGCGNEYDRTKPYIIGQKPPSSQMKKYYGNRPDLYHKSVIESEKIRAEKEKEIALINKQRDIALERLKQTVNLQKADIEKVIAFKKSDMTMVMAERSASMQKNYLILVAVTIVSVMIFLFYFLQKRRRDRLKMHEDTLHKEMYLKDREIQVKMVERILDTLETGALSSEQQTKLVETLSRSATLLPAISRDSPHKETQK